ncbi:hypothetical protein F5Y17DRAFT_455897 [Xylariaceae sp. FL0594]|nr:hypothetical protein F5Y17DRAFT_455897 [Xylariaceae sp. FL0594]
MTSSSTAVAIPNVQLGYYETVFGQLVTETRGNQRWVRLPTGSARNRAFLLAFCINDEEIIRRENFFRAILVASRGNTKSIGAVRASAAAEVLELIFQRLEPGPEPDGKEFRNNAPYFKDISSRRL